MSAHDRTSLVLKRTFDAPVERVYAAWTDPDSLAQWFLGDDGRSCTVYEADPRVNGRYDIMMTLDSGEAYRVRGLYHEVEPNRKLVFSWAWDHEPDRESLVMVEFMDQSGKTLLTLTHTRFADQPSRDRHLKGWVGCLDHLQAWLAR
jgi:uncharacterized protein YndB with AHSA1/START domain